VLGGHGAPTPLGIAGGPAGQAIGYGSGGGTAVNGPSSAAAAGYQGAPPIIVVDEYA